MDRYPTQHQQQSTEAAFLYNFQLTVKTRPLNHVVEVFLCRVWDEPSLI